MSHHNKIIHCLFIVCLVSLGWPLLVKAERSLIVEEEQREITDQQGKQVILYKESHALE